MYRFIYIFILLTIFLNGCATKRIVEYKEVKVPVKVGIYKPIPEEFLKPCIPPEPPNKKLYVNSTPKRREILLGMYINDLFNTINVCNIRLKSIKDYDNKMKNLYKEEIKK